MAIITIGGVAAPAPTDYSVELNDIDGSGSTRSDAAILHREILRQDTASVSATFRCSQSDMTDLVAQLSVPEVTVVFFAPVSGMYKTAQMYCAKKSLKLVHSESGDSLWDLSISLIEY